MPVTQPPSTDPYVRNYRIRLLPWVMTIRPTRYGQSYPPLDVCRVSPARCPMRVANRRIALGPPPSLGRHHFRRRAI